MNPSNDMTRFEREIGAMFSDYANNAPTDVDETVLAASIAHASRRTITVLGTTFARPRWLTPLLVTALLVVALATAVFIGAQLLRERRPIHQQLKIQAAAFMSQQRGGPAAVRLKDGRVLIIGGHNAYAGGNVSFAEIYDPATREFAPIGSAPTISVRGQAATLLRDGRV